MSTGIITYESYHPHLWYTLTITCISWLAVMCYGRLRLQQHPAQRVWLYALSIVLPVFGEGVSYLIFLVRPAPETPLGSDMMHFHAALVQHLHLDFDTYLSPMVSASLIVVLSILALVSLLRFCYGMLQLRAALHGALPLEATPHRFLLTRLQVIAASSHLSLVPILVIPSPAPLAFTLGVARPCIYVAEGLLETLTDDETLAVLCHEWAHVLRRDALLNWIVRLLRDIVCFLPGTLALWRALLASQDEACDLLAARLTRQPLALARALVKVTAAWNACPIKPASLLVASSFSIAYTGPQRRVEQMLAWDELQYSADTRVFGVYVLSAVLFVLAVLPVLLGS